MDSEKTEQRGETKRQTDDAAAETVDFTSAHDQSGDPTTAPSELSAPVDPTTVEEFSILEKLGRGGFGTVYLAYDNTLQREVALKIPHRRLVGRKGIAETYLREARAIASLDHSCIIPVYRAASTVEIPCYIVTKRIRGCHLGQWRSRNRPSLRKIVDIVANVADALAYAHKQGVVHRDIKPGNILIDDDGHPYVADFGLALRDIDPKGGPTYVGTPAYMSPEQARGEGHRVDGRSDIFSLGVVLYELITGHRPFRSKAGSELYDEILYSEPEHPCQLNSDLSPDLARICLKALDKAVGDRYFSAELMAAELRTERESDSITAVRSDVRSSDTATGIVANDSTAPEQPRVVPKGLRPFGVHDSDFFLQLLPGPHDRDGVPESIRFWVSKLEPSTNEKPVTVGVIYGPSGCGKTSLVRAGIIPRLSDDVTSIYVQATAHDTEKDLASQIASRVAAAHGLQIDQSLSIDDAFATLRRLRQKRTVIFLDQFEQWLFAHPDCGPATLTKALRQCDGEHLQCVLMVRDDFWMGVTRMMHALDLKIAENVNVTAVDLFDTRHARNVLAQFGAAFGRLPDSIEKLSPNQSRFLDAAVDYLGADGRVICVQLALLSEMLKTRPWDNPTGVFRDGGAGLGMRFFEETFDSENTPRRVRAHADGMLRVLRAVLPDSNSRIKGTLRTEEELFRASGYRDKAMFRELVSILDRELHLITPTDLGDDDSFSSDSVNSGIMSTGYHLTHDFLIAPIRQWVELQSRTTKQGKARLRLDEFAELYRVHPRPQSLPTISEYVAIRRFVGKTNYTDPQQKMMSAARSRHLRVIALWIAGAATVFGLVFAVVRGIEKHSLGVRNQAAVERLLDANMSEAISLSRALRQHTEARDVAVSLLNDEEAVPRRRVRAAILMVDRQPKAADFIADYALSGPVDDVVAISRGVQLPLERVANLWREQTAPRLSLIRAACLLANGDNKDRLIESDEDAINLTKLLLAENPVWTQQWGRAFEPVASQLVPHLAAVLEDETRGTDSLNAANLLVTYASEQLELLTSLIRDARPDEMAVLVEAIKGAGNEGVTAVRRTLESHVASASNAVNPSQPWGSAWWCVGDRNPIDIATPLISLKLKERLANVESVIGPHAIVAQRVRESEFASLTSDLGEYGYRVADVLPYHMADESYRFVLWIRDGIESRFEVDLTAEQLREMNQAKRELGLVPDRFAVYLLPKSESDDDLRYSCVWIKVPENSGVIDGDMYIDVHQDDHQSEGWQRLGEREINLPRASALVRRRDGNDYFTSVRWRTDSHIGFKDEWNFGRNEFDLTEQFNRMTLLTNRLCLFSGDDSQRGSTPIWWLDLPIDSKEVVYQARREHLRLMQNLIGNGFYPHAINVTSIGEDPTPQFGSTWWHPSERVAERAIADNQTRNFSLALFSLGDTSQVERALESSDSEAFRGGVIAGFSQYRLRPDWLVEQVSDGSNSDRLRRSCAMALALYSTDAISKTIRDQVAVTIKTGYATAEPGLCSAMEAISQSWGLELGSSADRVRDDEIQSILGDRLVVIQPQNPVWMGSPANEPGRDSYKEPLTPCVIDRAFAIATKEVTIDQFLQFQSDYRYAKDYAPSIECPISGMSWFAAAKYCRWLSEREGVPESEMCYPRIEDIEPGFRLDNDFIDRIGYRLPTEAEWELACRGGAKSGRWFGFDSDLLDKHAWTARNSSYRLQPVGLLLPNDYGLFDMLGNAMEFVQGKFHRYPLMLREPVTDPGQSFVEFQYDDASVCRGGACLYQPLDARSAQREYHSALSGKVYITFRIARTVRLSD